MPSLAPFPSALPAILLLLPLLEQPLAALVFPLFSFIFLLCTLAPPFSHFNRCYALPLFSPTIILTKSTNLTSGPTSPKSTENAYSQNCLGAVQPIYTQLICSAFCPIKRVPSSHRLTYRSFLPPIGISYPAYLERCVTHLRLSPSLFR